MPNANRRAPHYSLDVDFDRDPSAVHVQLEGVAHRRLDVIRLPHCGAELLLVSVDGSTVDIRHDHDVLVATLHAPIDAGQRFSVRLVGTGPPPVVDCQGER